MPNRTIELMQVLYEIAMSIGVSLDLHTMLRGSLMAFVKALNCTAASVCLVQYDQPGTDFQAVHTFPRLIERNHTHLAALRRLPARPTATQLTEFYGQLPLSGQTDAQSHYHILELPATGVLILVKNGLPIEPLLLRSLKPLLAKLANAINACLQDEQIEILARLPGENPAPTLRIAGDSTLLYANEASRFLLKEWGVQVGEPVPAPFNTVVADALRLGTSRELEVKGGERIFSFFVVPIGEAHYANLYGRDVTLRYELERMRDDFVSTVTHELRTPLASIMGFIETLQTERPGPLTVTQKRFLNNTYSNAERLLRLIEELLMASQIQRGTLKLFKHLFSPAHAVTRSVELVTPFAAAKGVTVTLVDQWPVAEQIMGDQERLEQVLTNLLSNAIKFTPEGGQVFITTEQRETDWRCTVRDTGIGIPPAEISRLFQRFYRASNASAAHIQGTGLGLYVCKSFIEGHGGQIELTSQLGEGTTVWFTVPQRALAD